MAILRCPDCDYLQEVPNQHIGKDARCPACQHTARIFDTVKLLDATLKKQQLFDQHFSALKARQTEQAEHLQSAVKQHVQTSRENRALQQQLTALREENATLRHRLDPAVVQGGESRGEDLAEVEIEGYAFENQDYAESLNNFQPIVDWFEARRIKLTPNTRASDISGYFDEVAVLLGDNYATLQPLLEQLRFHQRKNHKFMNFHLEKYSKAEAKVIREFCRGAYEFAFFSRHFFNKQKNLVSVNLQTSPTIRAFFDGDWLEWYGFMKVASLFLQRNQRFACLRGADVVFPNQEKNELDMFFLLDNSIPLWIECKSGEFRDSLDKYQALRKRLDIPTSHAVLLVAGLEDDKVAAMSSMFGLTLVNERSLIPYIARLT